VGLVPRLPFGNLPEPMGELMDAETRSGLWVEWEDFRGMQLVLPATVKVLRCWFCFWTCSRAGVFKTLPRLKAYRDQGLVREWVGTIGDRPCCDRCARGIGGGR
jgi:hypothetical protein